MRQHTFHRTNNTGLPVDVPDFKSALLNMDIGRCEILKHDKYRPIYRPTSSTDSRTVNVRAYQYSFHNLALRPIKYRGLVPIPSDKGIAL